MVLADGAAHGKKKKLEWVEGPIHPSIEEIISPTSNGVASGNLKGVSPPTLQAPTNQRLWSGPLLFHLEGGVVHKI